MAAERHSLGLVLSENPPLVWPELALLGGCHPPLPVLPPLLSTLPLAPFPAATALTASHSHRLRSFGAGERGLGWLPAVGSQGRFTGPSILLTPLYKAPLVKPLRVGTAKLPSVSCREAGGPSGAWDPSKPSWKRQAWQPPQPAASLHSPAALLKCTSSSEMAVRPRGATHQTAKCPHEKRSVREGPIASSWLMIKTILTHNQ